MSSFLADFDNFLELFSMAKKHVIVGDFNLHIDDVDDAYVKRFSDIIFQYGFSQYVKDPTHNAGHTLDLLLVRESDNCVEYLSVCENGISDHSMIFCKLK